jgi:hypothetical protein
MQLADCLGRAHWLDGAFSAGDLMLASVPLRLSPDTTTARRERTLGR